MDPKVAKELEEWKVQELHEREAKLNKIMMEHKKKCMQRSPAIKFRQRYEMFKIAFIVALPVLAVWAFNDPYFQDRLMEVMDMRETPEQKERRIQHEEMFKNIQDQLKTARRQDEHARFMREQMAFQEARKQ